MNDCPHIYFKAETNTDTRNSKFSFGIGDNGLSIWAKNFQNLIRTNRKKLVFLVINAHFKTWRLENYVIKYDNPSIKFVNILGFDKCQKLRDYLSIYLVNPNELYSTG